MEEASSVRVGILISSVASEEVSWLWSGYIPLGKLTVLDGDPGQGKSTLALDLAARLSSGRPMPDQSEGCIPHGVVVLSAEDGLADTIRPRLEAAGADLEQILALPECLDDEGKERPPMIPDDLPQVRRAVEQIRAKLIIIDPLMAFLSGNTNSHKDQDIRRVLHLISGLADETGAAILVVRHLNKAGGGNPIYRGGGSIGIIGAARSGLLVGTDPDYPDSGDGKRVLASTKCNLAPSPGSLAFHIEQAPNAASHVIWDGACKHSASMLLAQGEESERGALDEAQEVLVTVLSDGPVTARQAKQQCRDAGIADRTRDRAKNALGIVSKKQGMDGGWVWELPKDANDTRRAPASDSGDVGVLRETDGALQSEQAEIEPSATLGLFEEQV